MTTDDELKTLWGSAKHTEPPSYHASLMDGLYVIANKASRMVMNVLNDGNGRWVQCSERSRDKAFASAVWEVRQHSEHDATERTVTITNLKSGKSLEVSAGDDKRWIIQYDPNSPRESSPDRIWKVSEESGGFFSIRNVKTGQAVAVSSSTPVQNDWLCCKDFNPLNETQTWEFERISRNVEEIRTILGTWADRLHVPYAYDAHFFVLPQEVRQDIWKRTDISRQRIRPPLFDSNAAVVNTKSAMALWARDNTKLDGYGCLCGLAYGKADQDMRSYNWYLSEDMHSLLIFDPMRGKEYTTSALSAEGFDLTFGIL